MLRWLITYTNVFEHILLRFTVFSDEFCFHGWLSETISETKNRNTNNLDMLEKCLKNQICLLLTLCFFHLLLIWYLILPQKYFFFTFYFLVSSKFVFGIIPKIWVNSHLPPFVSRTKKSSLLWRVLDMSGHAIIWMDSSF